jgi:hypothetical protein
MAGGLWLQYAVVVLAVAGSLAFVAKKQFPAGVRRLRIACAVPLVREGQPGWMRKLGRLIAPMAAGVASSCGSCNGCDP